VDCASPYGVVGPLGFTLKVSIWCRRALKLHKLHEVNNPRYRGRNPQDSITSSTTGKHALEILTIIRNTTTVLYMIKCPQPQANSPQYYFALTIRNSSHRDAGNTQEEKQNCMFWEEPIAYIPIIRHGPHRKRRFQLLLGPSSRRRKSPISKHVNVLERATLNPKTRLTVLARTSSNLPDRPTTQQHSLISLLSFFHNKKSG
jgi:hypothetical protein